MKQNSTFTSSQLQEFMQLVNTEQLDVAFQYLKQHNSNKRRRRRKSILDEKDDLISGLDS